MFKLIRELIEEIKEFTWFAKKLIDSIESLTISINDLKQLDHESILPDNQKSIDEAFKLRNGLYSYKKAKGLIREGE